MWMRHWVHVWVFFRHAYSQETFWGDVMMFCISTGKVVAFPVEIAFFIRLRITKRDPGNPDFGSFWYMLKIQICWNSWGNAILIFDNGISDIWQPNTCQFRFDPGAKFLTRLILESVRKNVRPVRKSGHFSWWDTIFENRVLTVPPN